MRSLVIALVCLLAGAALSAAQNNLYVGSNSSFATNIYSSGSNSFADVYIGYEIGSQINTLVVTNVGTVFNCSSFTGEPGTGRAFVGYQGSSNSLIVSGGATFSGYVLVGHGTNSSGNKMLVSGADTIVNGSIHVGYDGSSNSLVITNGGKFLGYLSVGGGTNAQWNNDASSGCNNSVVVSGEGSLLGYPEAAIRYPIFLGLGGSSNSITVSGGAKLAGAIEANHLQSRRSSIAVVGPNSVWTNADNTIVGGDNSQVLVLDGASVFARESEWSYLRLGNIAGVGGKLDLRVQGTGSLFNVNQLVLGNSVGDLCSMIVSGGAAIRGYQMVTSTSAASELLVQDPQSEIHMLNAVGINGRATLIISNGATMTAHSLGFSGGSQGQARGVLHGVGSKIDLSSLSLRDVGTTLSIVNDATLSVTNPITIGSGNPYAWIGNGAALDVGRFGGSDSAGKIEADFIELYSEGCIRFNQTNASVFKPSIYGEGLVYQLGSGTTFLTGTIQIRGAIHIFDGQLVLSNNSYMKIVVGADDANVSVNGAGTFTANGTFGFDLSQAPRRTGDSWQIVSAGSASYGPNFSVDGFNNSGLGKWDRLTNQTLYRFDQTSGTLSVVSGSTNIPYNRWVTNFPGLPNLSASADPDGDGYNNHQEFAFNGSPVDPTPAMLQIENSGSHAKISFMGRRNTSEAAYYVMTTTDLSSGTWQTNTSVSLIESADQSGVVFPDAYVRREFTIPASGRNFFRIKAEVPQ